MKLFDIFKRKDKTSKLTSEKSSDISKMSETDILLIMKLIRSFLQTAVGLLSVMENQKNWLIAVCLAI